MKKFILFLAFLILTVPAFAQKYEAGTRELMPQLIYGKTGAGAFVPLKVDANGVVDTSGGGAKGEDSSVIFNVKTGYGAMGDGIELYDGAITNTDNTFTSATATFTSADVGKVITIFNAGGTNTDLTTTIASVTSATEVELTDAAGATVSGSIYRYGTDDTNAIRSAVAAVGSSAGKAGIVFFPSGTYIINGLFNQTDNSQIALPTIAMASTGVSITFKGAVKPSSNSRNNVGSVLYATRYGTNGNYSVISGRNAGQTGDLTRVRAHFQDLTFRTVQNPSHSFLDLEDVDQASGDDLKFDTSIPTGATSIVPTTVGSYALKTPGGLNGNVPSTWSGIKITKFRNGILIGEHAIIDSIFVGFCVNALSFNSSNVYAPVVRYASVEQCQTSINFPVGTTLFKVDLLEIEKWGTGNFVTVTDINDTNNYGTGEITYSILPINGGFSFLHRTGGKLISTKSLKDGDGLQQFYRSASSSQFNLINTATSSATGGAGLVLLQDDGAATESGHRLGQLLFSGATTASANVNSASISSFAAEAFSASAAGTDMAFYTAPTGTTTRTEKARIRANGGIIVTPPTAQTIAAGNTITDNACGTIKKITSAGAVTTDTTNTFTAPAAGNDGCCMDVVNVGSNNITLDNNANFFSAGGADVVLGANDSARVCSTGASGKWYQIAGSDN